MTFNKILFSICILLITHYLNAQMRLSGTVQNAENGKVLPNTLISIQALAKQTTSNQNGNFVLENLKPGKYSITFNLTGYKPQITTIQLKRDTGIIVKLNATPFEMEEVVVSASVTNSKKSENSVALVHLTKQDLRHVPSNSLAGAIAQKVPGVSLISTGPGIAKPVIRGLSGNRVLTVSNGIVQRFQQWGDEHGLQADFFASGGIEVLRGPASLIYGSGAIGGVLHLLPPLPAQRGSINGEFVSHYLLNNGLTASSLMLEGNQKGFVWRLRGSYKNAHSYNTPDGYIGNTAFNEKLISGMLGTNQKWGYSHLYVTYIDGAYGLLDHGHDNDDGGDNEMVDGKSRDLALPLQKTNHLKTVLKNNVFIGNHNLSLSFGFQQNRLNEFEHAKDHPDIALRLNTYTANIKFFLAEKLGFRPIFGISGTFLDNKNSGEELLIPDYTSINAGVFSYIKKTFNKVTLNVGARFDFITIAAESMENANGELQFTEFRSNFYNPSGSIGVAYNIGAGFLLRANVGSAFRAPNLPELSSNGEHHGLERFEIGNSALSAEQSIQGDIGLQFSTSGILNIAVNAYSYYINNYIYLRRINNETIVHEDDTLPVFRYVQNNANLFGCEAVIDIHPVEWLHVGSQFSINYCNNLELNTDLPLIPAPTVRSKVQFEPPIPGNLVKKSWISIGLTNVFTQNRYDPAFETATPSYHLVNAGLGTTLHFNKNLALEMYILANNIFNVGYVSHLNRYKYQNVLNAGRNIQFGVAFSFNTD